MAAAAATVDHVAVAEGLGELKEGKGYSRLIVGGTTVAYLKKAQMAVPAELVKRAPKKLGSFVAEKNGRWANVAVKDTAAARAVAEYIVAKQTTGA